MARWLGWIFTCDDVNCPRELTSVSDDIEVVDDLTSRPLLQVRRRQLVLDEGGVR